MTIFGESAGSCSVESLLCSTKASGLFHRAICQSGTLKAYKITVRDPRTFAVASFPSRVRTVGPSGKGHLEGAPHCIFPRLNKFLLFLVKGYNSLENKIAIPTWMKLMRCETEDELREKLSNIENLLQIIKDLDPYTSQDIACSATIDGDFFTGKAPRQGYPNRKDRETLKSIFRKSKYK